jgi:hypothetical protein
MGEHTVDISRRGFAAAASVFGLAGATVALSPIKASESPQVPKTAALDLSDPAAALVALAKVKGSSSGRPRFGLIEGAVSALGPGGEMRPVLGIRGVSVAHSSRLPGGELGVSYRDFVLYCDIATGKAVETFQNPLNGRRVTAPVAVSDFSAHIPVSTCGWKAVAGRASLEEGPQWGSEREHRAGKAGPLRRTTQAMTHHAAMADLADGDTDRAASFGEFLRTGPWPSWLGMSDALAACLYRGHHESGFARPDDIPGGIMDELKSHRFWPFHLWRYSVATAAA